MPHAEPLANGDRPQSQFLSHLSSYPVVSDTISTFKSNPYGAKSLDIAAHAQEQYLEPILSSKQGIQAQSYIHPYAAKADSLGESGLKHVETHFPIIKEDTATVKDSLMKFLLTPVVLPLSVARQGYEWVSGKYAEELKANGGAEGGVVVYGKAAFTTGLVALEEGSAAVREWLAKVEKEGGEKFKEAKEAASKKGSEFKGEAEKKGQEAKKQVNGTA